jgi:hypothetical protein
MLYNVYELEQILNLVLMSCAILFDDTHLVSPFDCFTKKSA